MRPGEDGHLGSEDSAEAATLVLVCLALSPCSPGRSPAASRVLSSVPAPGHPDWPPLLLVFEVRAFSRGSASGSRATPHPLGGQPRPDAGVGSSWAVCRRVPSALEGTLCWDPAQEPGQPLGVKAETEGGTHADHLPSAWPCVLPSVRVEGLLPLTASCAPTAFTCPKRNWGRTQEAGGLVDRGLWTASLRAFPLSLTGQQVCVTFPCLSFPLWGDLHRGTDTAAQCRTRPHWPAAVGGHHGPPHRGGVGSAEAPVVGSLI